MLYCMFDERVGWGRGNDGTVAVAFFWRQFGAALLFPRFQVTLVKGSSMEPTLRLFQVALASRTRPPQRGTS